MLVKYKTTVQLVSGEVIEVNDDVEVFFDDNRIVLESPRAETIISVPLHQVAVVTQVLETDEV